MKLFFILISALIPSWGHIVSGNYRTVFAFQFILCLSIATISGLRQLGFLNTYAYVPLVFIILHATSCFIATRSISKKNKKIKIFWQPMILLPTLSMGILLITFIARSPILGIEIYHIPSRSMNPTLLQGDYIIVDQLLYRHQSPEAGDIATYYLSSPNKAMMIKRIQEAPSHFNSIKSAHVYMVGDNQRHSFDSRYHGPVPVENISGKAILIIFPGKNQLNRTWNRLLTKL